MPVGTPAPEAPSAAPVLETPPAPPSPAAQYAETHPFSTQGLSEAEINVLFQGQLPTNNNG